MSQHGAGASASGSGGGGPQSVNILLKLILKEGHIFVSSQSFRLMHKTPGLVIKTAPVQWTQSTTDVLRSRIKHLVLS